MTEVRIGDRAVGDGHPTFIVAELSGNHNGDKGKAIELVHVAADAGADAVKGQTYTPDSLTIDADTPWFRIGPGSPWEGRSLYELYREAATPWEWIPELAAAARDAGILFFSTPFDTAAVELHEKLDLPAQKIASFELVDHELVERAAATGRPVILSTGLADLVEIDEAVRVARAAGKGGVILLHCNSAYPSDPRDMDLRTIPHMAATWSAPTGLSDHTLGTAAAVAAVALGACMIEKHVCLSRDDPGPDSSFSLEPAELQRLVEDIRVAEQALGHVRYRTSSGESGSGVFRRSLFAVADISQGEPFTRDNVRSIRPGNGLPPKALPLVLGRRAACAIERGTPLDWKLIG